MTSIKGVWGGEYKNIFLFGTAMSWGKLAQLNVMIGCTRGRVEIWGNKGDMVVLRSQGERLSHAHYLYRDTFARSHNHCCRGKK